DDSYLYYPRPRLIDLMAGKVVPEQAILYSDQWYAKRNIRNVLKHRVVEIQPDAHRVIFQDGSQDGYDRLVLATGARNWVPPIPGADLDGVYTLRTMREAVKLRDLADRVSHAVMIGGGLLGLDMSAALRAHGIAVTVVEALPWLLPRQLDAEGAAVLQSSIESMGIEVITGGQDIRVVGNERVERVEMSNGCVVPTGMVVVSTGIRPNIELARAAGLACDRGVLVNEHLQADHPHIYAAGDVAEYARRVWGIIPAAVAQARVVADQIVGHDEVVYHDIVPNTTLKVTGIDVASMGEVHPQGGGFREIRYTDTAHGIYKKVVLRDGHVVGAILIGARNDLRAINQLVAGKIDVSAHEDELLDEGFDLMALAQSAGGMHRS
ncbi:MAG TPA: NAD(P)/FAD-dependent oxidoreductase, partial [Chloroflexi bacterium]|nr:NAD(P)/FAD-dependent oxidoreductase [Chloroflexota bacterium]